ncbi:MAG: alanine racemase [Anaeromyxobacteraceae bacterium]
MSITAAQWTGRPCWAEIDLDALAHNVRVLAVRAAPTRLMAVVKANAYGHGAVACGRAALEAGAVALAVVCVDEGEELRRAGIAAPIVVIGYTPPSDAERVAAHGLQPAVGDPTFLEALSRAAAARGVTVSIHLELETGLNRHGLVPDALVALAERARAMPGIRVEGIFTHFAAAEEGDQRFTKRQFEILRTTAARVPWIPTRHCSASATTLLDPEMALDLVRPGLAMYGYKPAPWVGTEDDLLPVLSLRSRVARVLEIEPGETVGYGRTWAASRRSRIALVMCGYGDGYRRGYGNRAHVVIGGRRAPVVGRVAMDMCMVDVTALPEVHQGDVVTLLGRDGDEKVDADELAALADTISWEVLTAITSRVPRLYVKGGEVVTVTTLNERVPEAARR